MADSPWCQGHGGKPDTRSCHRPDQRNHEHEESEERAAESIPAVKGNVPLTENAKVSLSYNEQGKRADGKTVTDQHVNDGIRPDDHAVAQIWNLKEREHRFTHLFEIQAEFSFRV